MQQLPTILPPPPLADGTEAPPRSKERQDNLIRFQTELEFIQCLSNPLYLRELSDQNYFSDPAFINYLKYLEYWRQPEYIRFIVYPTCLVYLTLLQVSTFRERLSDPVFINELSRIGIRHHETWRIEKNFQPSIRLPETLDDKDGQDVDGDEVVDANGLDRDHGNGPDGDVGRGRGGKRRKGRGKEKEKGGGIFGSDPATETTETTGGEDG